MVTPDPLAAYLKKSQAADFLKFRLVPTNIYFYQCVKNCYDYKDDDNPDDKDDDNPDDNDSAGVYSHLFLPRRQNIYRIIKTTTTLMIMTRPVLTFIFTSAGKKINMIMKTTTLMTMTTTII